jgi:putative membrane protein
VNRSRATAVGIRRWVRDRPVRCLGGLYGVLWLALAISPTYRADWALENVLVLAVVGALAATYRRFPLSTSSYALIFAFLVIHAIGAHYTYAEVPYDAWAESLTGRSLTDRFGWRRNHFDRLAHLAYGLLLVFPIREVFTRVARVRGFWSYFLPFDVTVSTSSLYELVEWGAALVFGGDLGVAYLGTQGDPWDAQRDMALAALGALLGMTGAALADARRRRGFAREWRASLRAEPAEAPDRAGARRRRPR